MFLAIQDGLRAPFRLWVRSATQLAAQRGSAAQITPLKHFSAMRRA
jgi:hypothetical protein